MERNRFGLARDIPDEIKRSIRQAAGFGCVCCGCGIGTYEHIDPEFCDTREHDPERMTYLCGSCHLKVTRRIWSKDRILEARARPWCPNHGGPHEAFDIGSSNVALWLGPIRIADVPTILKIAGETLLRLDAPESDRAPYRISGKFYDPQGTLLFTIRENEWIGELSVWDIECIGPRITVRQGSRHIALRLCAVPPNGIVIEYADFTFGGSRVYVDGDVLRVVSPTGATATVSSTSVVGDGKDSVFLSVNNAGHYELAGPLSISTSAISPPRVPPLRVEHVGRNNLCFCGSGKKFKRCHGV
jgi:hypothetical protein